MRAVALTTWLQLALTICLTSGGQLLLKLAAVRPGVQQALDRGPGPLLLAAATEPRLVLGVLLYALSVLTWVLVLTRLDLSIAYPIAASSFVVVLLLSWATLGEAIGPLQLVGATLVLGGVVCIVRPQAA